MDLDELIGARLETIKLAEDRELFRNAMQEIGLKVPQGGCVHTVEEAGRRERVWVPPEKAIVRVRPELECVLAEVRMRVSATP